MATHTTRDGTRLSYAIRGKGGPSMIFVHGWCSNRTHWEAQMRYFGKRHRVLAIDRRGHGRSESPDHGYTAKQHASDLAEVARRERVASAIVVGHAGGGPSVMELARSHPERVRALVLIDSMVGPRAKLDDPKDPAGVAFRQMVDSIRGPRGARYFRSMYADLFSAHAGEPGRRALAEAMKTPRDLAATELESLAISTQAIARQIVQPVLWLTVRGADEAAVGKAFRNVEFGQAVGTGHFPHLEVPDQVNAMIERFVRTL